MDEWMRPLNMDRFGALNTLDMFDPFDELDTTIGRNFQWLNRPEFMSPLFPRVPQKYRVSLDCYGYDPKNIKTDCKNNTLTVIGSEKGEPDSKGDFFSKEFKKTYKLPDNAECDKLVSFMTPDGQLVVEVPLKETRLSLGEDMLPKIVDAPDGSKQVSMKFQVPNNIKPENIDVSVKDRCLVVKAEEKKENQDSFSRFNYYQKTTLPENTDFNNLKCNLENNQLLITAPVDTSKRLEYTKIPIQHKK